ncbi:replication initiation negative regulator SeqA [Aliidiomarina celeris]|uniref:replication initiation negative regulator SeqA n=1 Tax=Aliidiomarina celeris TaxID=2249428 RepID=UPI000DEB2525|nr:replication initiation negative regulator SeqA [Aliidiomarina celeris]
MKRIDIDDELYRYIASHTQFIGESASDILRRLLDLSPTAIAESAVSEPEPTTAVAVTCPENSEKGVVTEPARSAGEETRTSNTPESAVEADVAGKVLDNITDEDLAAQKGKVGRFLYILSVLYRCHTKSFHQVLNIRGRDRLYFATSEQALLQSGKSTNPKEIPGSGFWVITNSNTTKKKSMLTRVAETLGYSAAEAEKIRDYL